MATQDEAALRSRLEATFGEVGVRRSAWECGDRIDGRYCLIKSERGWTAGFFERGLWDVKFEVPAKEDAAQKFVEWVATSEARQQSNVRATEAWLRAHGKHRP